MSKKRLYTLLTVVLLAAVSCMGLLKALASLSMGITEDVATFQFGWLSVFSGMAAYYLYRYSRPAKQQPMYLKSPQQNKK